jgi:hypothetical protein
MNVGRNRPGACVVCGAAHSTCTAADHQASITVVQLPARDAAELVRPQPVAEVALPALGDGTDGKSFSTATYRGKKRR